MIITQCQRVLRIMFIDHELTAIITIQSVARTKPDETFGILEYFKHRNLRQTIFQIQVREIEVLIILRGYFQGC